MVMKMVMQMVMKMVVKMVMKMVIKALKVVMARVWTLALKRDEEPFSSRARWLVLYLRADESSRARSVLASQFPTLCPPILT